MIVTSNVDGMLSLRIVVLKKHGVRNSRGEKKFTPPPHGPRGTNKIVCEIPHYFVP
jgi:hypothetical protein